MENVRDVRTVCVIGGGVAGVVTAKALLSRGFSVSLFEQQDKLGGLWVDNYYGVTTQEVKALYEYPEKPYGDDVPRLPKAQDVVNYINEFAEEHGVLPCCKLRHTIEEVSRPSESLPWNVSYRNPQGESFLEKFDFVAVCTGLQTERSIPDFSGIDQFKGKIVHNSQWKSPEEFEGKRVVVLGNGKGATDAVVGAVGPGKEVHQVVRSKHWYIPVDFFGIIPFEQMMMLRSMSWMTPAFDGPAGAIERSMKWMFAPFTWLMFRHMEMILSLHWRLPKRLLPDSKVKLEVDGAAAACCCPREEYGVAVREEEVEVHVSAVKSFTDDGVVLENGETIPADVVVMATGHNQKFPYFEKSVQDQLKFDSDGLWLYRQILHPNVPGLAFIGSNTLSYTSACTFSLQAAWVARMLTKQMAVPSKKEMWKDLEEVKHVRRTILPHDSKRAAIILSRCIEYQDLLCRDMGREPRRKGLVGFVQDYFTPVYPSTYRNFVED